MGMFDQETEVVTIKIGKATILEFKATIATFSIKFDALSKIFVLVIFQFSSLLWCSDLAISYSVLQCKIINSIKGHYFA